MRVGEIRQFCKLDGAGESLIRAAMGQMNLSARGCHRVLKLARTIADLAGSEQIQAAHLAEALHLRQAEDDDGIGRKRPAKSRVRFKYIKSLVNIHFRDPYDPKTYIWAN